MDFFERMRGRSHGEKNRYALIAAFVVAGMAATAWAVSLPARLATTESAEAPSADADTESGFGDIFNSVGSQLGSIVDSLQVEGVPDQPEGQAMEESVPQPPAVETIPPQESVLESMVQGTTSADGADKATTTPTPKRTVLIATSTGQRVEQ